MIWEEAEARAELERQFWAELQYSEEVFLWRPRRNAATGNIMWLRKAVKAFSGHTVDVGPAEYEFTITRCRWYKPKDFVIKQLQRG